MSTHQHTKPRRANQSMTEESGLPGTVRSNVGCDAIDEPCTNSTAGLPSGASTNFSHRKRRTSPLCAQCSTPVTCAFTSVPLLLEILVNEGDRHAALADRGSNTFDRAQSHVP